MNTLTNLLNALPRVPQFLAHPGHPGPADHGDITHIIVGLLVALLLLAGTGLTLRHLQQRKVTARRTARSTAEQDKSPLEESLW